MINFDPTRKVHTKVNFDTVATLFTMHKYGKMLIHFYTRIHCVVYVTGSGKRGHFTQLTIFQNDLLSAIQKKNLYLTKKNFFTSGVSLVFGLSPCKV